jgi:hypothetical protein
LNYVLVNGIEEKNTEYNPCVLVRDFDDMCGEEGKMYKKKYILKSK